MKKKFLILFMIFVLSINLISINSIIVKGNVKEPRTTWDCIWFGTYPQTGYSSSSGIYFKDEPIKWRILKYDGYNALLLSDKILDQYNAYIGTLTGGEYVYRGVQMDFVWRNTEIRTYMNYHMYEKAFSEKEQAAILDSKVTSSFEYKEYTDITVDKLFILSYDEMVNNYGFNIPKSLLCRISDYAKYSSDDKKDSYGEYGTYYTLTEGYKSYNIYADYGESVSEYAFCWPTINAIDDTGAYKKVDALNYNGIRVAMWVDLKKCDYQYAGTVSSDGEINEVEFKTTTNSFSKNNLTRVKIKSAKNIKKKTILIKFKKVNNAKKYKIQYATNKKFKKAKIKTSKKTTYRLKKLKLGKRYYIRVRAVNGKKQGKWSKVKRVKIKK